MTLSHITQRVQAIISTSIFLMQDSSPDSKRADLRLCARERLEQDLILPALWSDLLEVTFLGITISLDFLCSHTLALGFWYWGSGLG